MKIFAVVCNGSVEGLSSALGQYSPRYSCLYNEPIDDEILRNAPFLVEVNEGMKAWLASLKTPWGMYFITSKAVDFNGFRQHLRRFTYVKIPSQSLPVMFRFYDPRVFWRFAQVIDDQQLSVFLKDVELVATNFNGFREDGFLQRRNSFGHGKVMRTSYLTLNADQELRINSLYQEEFVSKLQTKMFDFYVDVSEEEGSSVSSEFWEGSFNLSQDLYSFCRSIGIDDQNSIFALAKLFILKKIYFFNDAPDKWITDLKDQTCKVYYRVRLLVAEEIGERFYWEN